MRHNFSDADNSVGKSAVSVGPAESNGKSRTDEQLAPAGERKSDSHCIGQLLFACARASEKKRGNEFDKGSQTHANNSNFVDDLAATFAALGPAGAGTLLRS